ncbi:MAG: class I SAM-dependent methyltransferase [Nitrosopumilaceae archaeon]
MSKKVFNMFKKVGMGHFFGDFFDARFYVADLLSRKQTKVMLDIGCGAGVLLNCSKASLKIGLDISRESLKKGKILNPEMELIQGDATHLPFKNNYFSNIIAMHLIPVVHILQGDDWLKSANEIKRIATENCEVILTGANRMSRHFEKTHLLEDRKKYLTYQEQVDFFKNDFDVLVEGYGPHSKKIMYLLRIIYKIPDRIAEGLRINRLLYRVLRSKRYLKNGRSYLIICKKHKKDNIMKRLKIDESFEVPIGGEKF